MCGPFSDDMIMLPVPPLLPSLLFHLWQEFFNIKSTWLVLYAVYKLNFFFFLICITPKILRVVYLTSLETFSQGIDICSKRSLVYQQTHSYPEQSL